MSDDLRLRSVSDLGLDSIKKSSSNRKKRIRNSWAMLSVGLVLAVVVAVVGALVPTFGIIGTVGLTVVAGVFQVLSVIVAGGTEPHETMVRSQLINGITLSGRLQGLRAEVEAIYETGTTEQRRKVLGEVSAAFTYLQDHADMSVYGWMDVRPDLVLEKDPPFQPSPPSKRGR